METSGRGLIQGARMKNKKDKDRQFYWVVGESAEKWSAACGCWMGSNPIWIF